jgi:cytochrome c biogenesis factor
MTAVIAFAPFSHGGWIFLIFILVFTVSVIYSLYTRRGSAINQRPSGNVYHGAPGAKGASQIGSRRDEFNTWTRGTK